MIGFKAAFTWQIYTQIRKSLFKFLIISLNLQCAGNFIMRLFPESSSMQKRRTFLLNRSRSYFYFLYYFKLCSYYQFPLMSFLLSDKKNLFEIIMIILFCFFQIFSFHLKKKRDKISYFIFSASNAISTILRTRRGLLSMHCITTSICLHISCR